MQGKYEGDERKAARGPSYSDIRNERVFHGDRGLRFRLSSRCQGALQGVAAPPGFLRRSIKFGVGLRLLDQGIEASPLDFCGGKPLTKLLFAVRRSRFSARENRAEPSRPVLLLGFGRPEHFPFQLAQLRSGFRTNIQMFLQIGLGGF